ncbi:FHA domain-containing protein [Tersicoccus sp. MR15.9]|uniref:FHA domain-containing protein n=1 Tax=Tersicoccus mangrovi TaxID=3121635 RepID=UPI002FE6267B
MTAARYRSGDWTLLARLPSAGDDAGAMVLLPPGTPADTGARIWDALTVDSGTGGLPVGDPTSIGAFAGAVLGSADGIVLRVAGRTVTPAVRGAGTVTVTDADGDRQWQDGTDSEIVADARSVTASTGPSAPGSAGGGPGEDDGVWLPLRAGIVAASELTFALPEAVSDAVSEAVSDAVSDGDADAGAVPERSAAASDAVEPPEQVDLPASDAVGPSEASEPSTPDAFELPSPDTASAAEPGEPPSSSPVPAPTAIPAPPSSAPTIGTGEAADRPSTGPLVLARVCPDGHANPPAARDCGRCGRPLAADPRRVPRPSLGVLTLADGRRVELDRPAVVGRQPAVTRGAGADMPRIVTVASPNGDVSRSHVRVRLDGWHVLLDDLESTNGTLLRRIGQPPRRLGRGESTMLLDGDVVDLGDGVVLTFEARP